MDCIRTLDKIVEAEKPKTPKPPKFGYTFENLTPIKCPLLKHYYWKSFNINGLNQLLRQSKDLTVEHNLLVPRRLVYQPPLGFVFWLRNTTGAPLSLKIKRIQRCGCVQQQVRVGFNQYRQLYRCPHRRLVRFLEEELHFAAEELLALNILLNFNLLGEHVLSCEFSSSDGRTLLLNFQFNVTQRSQRPYIDILNPELLPVLMRDFNPFIQPLWLVKLMPRDLPLEPVSLCSDLQILTNELLLETSDVDLLLLAFKPRDTENWPTIEFLFGVVSELLMLEIPAVMETVKPQPLAPILDLPCNDLVHVIYPNYLCYEVEVTDRRSLLVTVHNYDKVCCEYQWGEVSLPDLFKIFCKPEHFRLKPGHNQYCQVFVEAQDKTARFEHTPLQLNVQRMEKHSVRIQRQEIGTSDFDESLDEPLPAVEKTRLLLDINVYIYEKPKLEPEPLIPDEPGVTQRRPEDFTIFERLYWNELRCSDHMRFCDEWDIDDPAMKMSYGQVMQTGCPRYVERPTEIASEAKNVVLDVLGQMAQRVIHDIGKNWKFIPFEFCLTYDHLSLILKNDNYDQNHKSAHSRESYQINYRIKNRQLRDSVRKKLSLLKLKENKEI